MLASGGLAITTVSPAVAASCSGVKGDVNGDGLAEVAVVDPGNRTHGAVHVLYGHSSGLVADKKGTALDDQYFNDTTSGLPGSGAQRGYVETAVLGDFNDDGCADLGIRTDQDVVVLYGSPQGIVTKGSHLLGVSALPKGAKVKASGPGDLEVADLDDDGVDDVAIAANDTEIVPGGRRGAVLIAFGDRAGLNKGATKAELVHPGTPGVGGTLKEIGGPYASALTSGDFDGDGLAEVAVETGESSFQTLERGPNGWGNAQRRPIGGSTAGFPKRGCWQESGWAVDAGDLNGDGRADLAVGNPSYHCPGDPGAPEGQGAVLILFGSAQGLTTAGHQLWTGNALGVDSSKNRWAGFGGSIAVGPLDNGPTDDLAIGAFWSHLGSTTRAGSVTVLLGSSRGLTTAGLGGTRFTQNTAGIAGTAEKGDGFGGSLTIAAVQSQQRGNLIIGVPFEDVGKVLDAGAFTQLAATGAGPTATGSRTYDASSKGVKGTASEEDWMGYVVG